MLFRSRSKRRNGSVEKGLVAIMALGSRVGEGAGERMPPCYIGDRWLWGARVAQSVKRWTSAQVTISWFMGLCPTSDSVLTAQSLEPALDSVSPTLSAPPLLVLCLCLTKRNKHEKKIFKNHLIKT